MPKGGSPSGFNGRVRATGANGFELSDLPVRRFPLIAECTSGGAPGVCRHTHCRYHLEHRGYGEHRLQPTRDCALVVANEGEHTLDEVASVLGVSAEHVRQIEARALRKLRRSDVLDGFDEAE